MANDISVSLTHIWIRSFLANMILYKSWSSDILHRVLMKRCKLHWNSHPISWWKNLPFEVGNDTGFQPLIMAFFWMTCFVVAVLLVNAFNFLSTSYCSRWLKSNGEIHHKARFESESLAWCKNSRQCFKYQIFYKRLVKHCIDWNLNDMMHHHHQRTQNGNTFQKWFVLETGSLVEGIGI